MKKIERTFYLNRLRGLKDTPDINIIAPITIPIVVINPIVLNPDDVTIKFHIVVTAPGNPDIIPINIIIDIPFPIPLLVICSPSHISKDVPATNEATTNVPVSHPSLINIPDFLYDKYIPIDSTKANIIVIIFVYLFITLLPSSPPSLVNLSSEGIIIANNWTTIDAVMYGLIDIAKIENLEKAPPEIISINPAIPFDEVIASFNTIVFTPGTVM